ncbi:uncharacterized protein LOC101747151 [Bombyx mori]|uniref:Uncharacterized protein n=2 Tax=Bombyx mori TaxID=7091 RepID=A0A8R2AVC6_BOMMO|nr:uncharacterized protein LOC101747151 isoform X1 [Bombyx mori]
MELSNLFHSLPWYKPDWCYPSMSKENYELLKQCNDLPKTEFSDDIEDIINRSKNFSIPFPIESVRLDKLKKHRPIDRLKRNISGTYPIIHERILMLMTHFLLYKREFGSSIEKAFYKDMTIPELIDRLLLKRAVSFMGELDSYLLLSGESGEDGWENVGTLQQRPPLLLENVLSYDEMKLSAFLFVSGPTECINDGSRHNSGVVKDDDIEQEAIIIGAIGPRFERTNRMDYEDIVISSTQNSEERGYGEHVTPTTCLHVLRHTYTRDASLAKHAWRQLWAELYQVHSYTYEELSARLAGAASDRYVKLPRGGAWFDNEVYYKRICILAETVLLEAEGRARGRSVFLNVVGCGLGVWKISPHQTDVYVLTFLERIRAMLDEEALDHITDVNFAYIRASDNVTALFTKTNEIENSTSTVKSLFVANKKHPKGGVSVQLEDREPASRLHGRHRGKLLVLIYPWDGNAHPGNEFWLGSLTGSGDPAAACSTQVAELHNAHVNPRVAAANTRVAAHAAVLPLRDCAERP